MELTSCIYRAWLVPDILRRRHLQKPRRDRHWTVRFWYKGIEGWEWLTTIHKPLLRQERTKHSPGTMSISIAWGWSSILTNRLFVYRAALYTVSMSYSIEPEYGGVSMHTNKSDNQRHLATKSNSTQSGWQWIHQTSIGIPLEKS